VQSSESSIFNQARGNFDLHRRTALSVSDPEFETGYDKPSPDDPALFSRYADSLRLRYRDSSGYRVVVVKEASKTSLRSWNVSLLRGWFAGAQVSIKPIGDTPHRVMVQVEWHTKFMDILTKGFVIISLPVFFALFIALAIRGRIALGLLVTFVRGLVWLMAGAVVMLLLAKLGSKIFGNEFDFNRRSEIARDLKLVPLPIPALNQAPASG
jgi:hypothetical protein